MGKKRSVSARSNNKRAQITIFIILGIILLFSAIFVISLVSSFKKTSIETQKEDVLTKAFKKEGLRLYVEDCLHDELEKGLILLGKQGRIWNDQPGGSRAFAEGKSGVLFADERIFYGITDKKYSLPNAYPCNTNTSPPEFCKYINPLSSIGYGELIIKESTLKDDLIAYLTNRTIWCIENFTKTNISKEAQLSPQKLEMQIFFEKEGINIKAEYPLKIKLGKDELFELSTFDFFYPSQFKSLLQAAVSLPLEKDYRYLDYNLSQETLAQDPSTGELYSSLGIRMETQSLQNGDDLFTFTPITQTIIDQPFPYYFRIARQNRPPALDYVHRYECSEAGYDYLVIRGEQSNDGNLDLIPFSLDPDEDKFNFSFTYPNFLNNLIVLKNSSLFVNFSPSSTSSLSSLPVTSPYFNITVNVTDEHGKSDWQVVRVLVDNPIQTGLVLSLPYPNINNIYTVGNEQKYIVSREDPVFLNITYPGKSIAPSSAQVQFNYASNDQKEIFQFDLSTSSGATNKCVALPSNPSNTECELSKYKNIQLNNWNNLFNDPIYGHFKQIGEGSFTLSAQVNYCGGLNKTNTAITKVIVTECVPYQNPEHPFPYPYHEYTFKDGKIQKNTNSITSIDPLFATHSCCIGNLSNPSTWKLADNNTICFTNPEIGCYGKVKDLTSIPGYGGYVLEEEFARCDNLRGNVCGEEEYKFVNNTFTCGFNNKNNCANIVKDCEGRPSYSLIEDKGWCYGTMGCQNFCTFPVVYNFIPTTQQQFVFGSSEILSKFYSTSTLSSESEASLFKCGCGEKDNGKPCDSNYDGLFEGTCTKTQCLTKK